jgi:hypothetical protein
MPTLREAIALFDDANTRCQVPDRRSGGFLAAPMKPSRRDPIVSNVKVAVENLIASLREHAYTAAHDAAVAAGADALDAAKAGRLAADAAIACPADVLDFELGPFMASLPAHAGSRADAPKDRQKRESNVKLFLTVVCGLDFSAPRPVAPSRVHEPWRCLYDPLVRYAEADLDKRRNLPNGLLKLQDLMLSHGLGTPADTPDRQGVTALITAGDPDLAEVKANKRAHWLLGAYRTACRVAGLSAAFPQHYELIEEKGVGIKSLPDWIARARAKGFAGDPRDITALELIQIFAPRLHLMLDRYLEQGASALRRPAWRAAQIDRVSWIVAPLIRAGVEPTEVHWPSLFLERQAVEASVDEARDEVLNEYYRARGRAHQRSARTVQHSLLRRCLDVSAKRSWENSPLWLINPMHELDEVPRYTDKHLQHLEAAFVLTREMYGRAMLASDDPETRADWGLAQAEFESLMRHVEEFNRGRPVDGRKDKSGMPITWPQAVCMGLPYLRQQALLLRSEVEDARQRRGHLTSASSRGLLNRYHEALREWVIATMFLDDCLRVKNYSGARANEHIVPIVEKDREGRWTAVTGLITRWRGHDHPKVALKMTTDKDGNPRKRERQITPALLDARLLTDYWMQARVYAAVSARLLPSVEAYDPDEDRLAFIVTPRPKQSQHNNPDWYGDMTTDQVSDILGRALYRMCREVLGLDLPEWDSPDLTEKFRALFRAHVVRTAAASYLGGLRGQWALAEELTDDEEATLRKHYSRVQRKLSELQRAVGWTNPNHFDAVVDRMLAQYPEDDWAVFWRTFDPNSPDPALRTMVAATEVARHGLGSVAARRRGRASSPRPAR